MHKLMFSCSHEHCSQMLERLSSVLAVHPPSNVRQACSVSEGAYYIQWSAPSGEEEPVTSYTVELSNGETVVTGNSQTELAVIRGGGGGGNLVFNATEVGGIGGRGNLVRNVSGVQTMFGFLKHFTVYLVRVRASYGRVMSDYSETGYFRTPSYSELTVCSHSTQRYQVMVDIHST